MIEYDTLDMNTYYMAKKIDELNKQLDNLKDMANQQHSSKWCKNCSKLLKYRNALKEIRDNQRLSGNGYIFRIADNTLKE